VRRRKPEDVNNVEITIRQPLTQLSGAATLPRTTDDGTLASVNDITTPSPIRATSQSIQPLSSTNHLNQLFMDPSQEEVYHQSQFQIVTTMSPVVPGTPFPDSGSTPDTIRSNSPATSLNGDYTNPSALNTYRPFSDIGSDQLFDSSSQQLLPTFADRFGIDSHDNFTLTRHRESLQTQQPSQSQQLPIFSSNLVLSPETIGMNMTNSTISPTIFPVLSRHSVS
jgi:hypothetical protein